MSGLLSQLSYKPVPFYYTQFFQKCKRELCQVSLMSNIKNNYFTYISSFDIMNCKTQLTDRERMKEI